MNFYEQWKSNLPKMNWTREHRIDAVTTVKFTFILTISHLVVLEKVDVTIKEPRHKAVESHWVWADSNKAPPFVPSTEITDSVVEEFRRHILYNEDHLETPDVLRVFK